MADDQEKSPTLCDELKKKEAPQESAQSRAGGGEAGGQAPPGQEPAGKEEKGEAGGQRGKEEPSPRTSRLKALLRSRRVQVILVLALIAIGLLIWWYLSFYESTDDAQIDGHINQISSRVSGNVIGVHFEDNQFIKAGSVLVEIDPTDYRVLVDRARAQKAEAEAAAGGARIGVPITSTGTSSQLATARARVDNARAGIVAAGKQLDAARARREEARAYNVKAQTDLRRYTPLVNRDIISRQQYDQAVANAQASAAQVTAADAAVRAAVEQVSEAKGVLAQMQADLRSAMTAPQQVAVARSRVQSAQAALKGAKAGVEQAELNLRYTKVLAPVDGITGKKGVEIGQNVQPGQVLLYLVPINDIWVTANFKETQLKKIRPGQRVTIKVDTYGRTYDGYVESIGAASGSRFSLFPPENATGNYIKVVQRIPVRIRFSHGQDPNHLLLPGMSVTPKVTVK
ncbi:HlyD family secretion protein [Geomonas sp.]|uniref:HlyD family secretion protein n=1 Tax=Geomonas sp. TaxID=2651584 RepID=UPI002B476BFD|nr:HlyD family secretion protein [Geomonas sp.]HJV34199.1 HlyD family secretion protein [Geomonas sp.]